MDASVLSDPAWHRALLRRYGPQWTSPADVVATYDRMELAADVRGRADVAQALSERVPGLVTRWAPVLAVLAEIHGDWLSKPLPEFVRMAEESTEPTWAELMAGLDDPSDGDDVDSSSSIDLDTSHQSEQISDISVISNRKLPSESVFPPVIGQESGQSRRYWQAAQLPLPAPEVMGEADLMREAKFAALGWPTRPIHASVDLSPGCVTGLSRDIKDLGSRMDLLRSINSIYTREIESQVLKLEPETLLGTLVAYRRLVRAVPPKSPPSAYITAVIEWLRGYVSPLIVYENTSVPLGEAWERRFALQSTIPGAVSHPELLVAGKRAWFCRQLGLRVDTDVDSIKLLEPGSYQWVREIHAIARTNLAMLMTPTIRQTLAKAWDELAGLYLGQHASVLAVLHESLQESSYQIDRIRPPLQPSLPEFVWNAFPLQVLEACWNTLIRAFGHDQVVELQMRELAEAVTARIWTTPDLGHLIDLKSIPNQSQIENQINKF